ncbi:hypothetical protein C1H46_024559 [Malus baccata]|uniref:Uncharacterized protein n=1 Tax=Malus baccata TaxID=106549 RepID=A0A540LTR5_MALBA|nr:hypothetical protein C1H46_024559 [Malus baccata]
MHNPHTYPAPPNPAPSHHQCLPLPPLLPTSPRHPMKPSPPPPSAHALPNRHLSSCDRIDTVRSSQSNRPHLCSRGPCALRR